MSSDRSFVCEGCKGTIRLPKGRRVTPFALSTMKAIHQDTCPANSRRPKQ